jgi:hypothetical protein
MTGQKTISERELASRWLEVLEEVHRDGVVYLVQTENPPSTGMPVGLIDDDGRISFVLGPPSICGRVLGLFDEEYGWPAPLEVVDITGIDDLCPSRRRHPAILRNSVCLALSIMFQEYSMIRRQLAADPPR